MSKSNISSVNRDLINRIKNNYDAKMLSTETYCKAQQTNNGTTHAVQPEPMHLHIEDYMSSGKTKGGGNR